MQVAIWAMVVWLTVVITGLSAWITHIVRCFTEDQWGFLLVGVLFFPLGIVHGIGIWFGWW